MEGIFVSYRREDTSGHAGRIFDHLKEELGSDRVFMDVAGIEPGTDFVEAIDRAVGSCAVLLVVIGRNWLTCTDTSGRRRLDDPKDFIRLETATALRRGIRVIPVLVQGAAMPAEENLPEELRPLARRQGYELTDTHWTSDMRQLIETLKKGLGITPPQPAPTPAPPTPPPSPAPAPKKSGRLLGIVAAVIAVLVVVSVVSQIKSGPRPGTGTSGTTVIVPGGTGDSDQGIAAPNLIGLHHDAAVTELSGSGLVLGTVTTRPADQPPGTVLDQRPLPGQMLRPGTPVDILVAVQQQQPAINLTGMWAGSDGLVYSLRQSGTGIEFVGGYPNQRPFITGGGVVRGGTVDLEFVRHSDGSQGAARFAIAANGAQLQGEFVNRMTGERGVMNLQRY